jgi:AraC family transcriptional regulator
MAQPNAFLLPETSELGSANAVLAARARQHSVREFPGPLSIKTVIDGRVAWKLEGREVWVDDSAFLVVNADEPYSMEIDAREPVATCCVFFERGYVERLAGELGRGDSHLLDEPAAGHAPLTFLSRLHPRDQSVIPSLRVLRDRILAGAAETEIEQRFLLLARDLLLVYQETKRQAARVPAARASTRDEMLRRASRGREFLHAHAGGSVSLKSAAREACLSPYHFHRIFTSAFGQSPHAYVTRLRLERAQQLLVRGLPVTEVCGTVGFESLGSFSALFRKRFGMPPSRYARGDREILEPPAGIEPATC